MSHARIYSYKLQSRVLSASIAPDLLYWISDVLDAGGQYICLDFEEISFMDSSGLGALVIANNRVQKIGGRLALCHLGGQARMLIEIAGMETLFETYPTVKEFQETTIS